MEHLGLPCWLVLFPAPQSVAAQKGWPQKVLWVLPHLGSPQTWWKQHLWRCGRVWLLCPGKALVTAAAPLSPAWLQMRPLLPSAAGSGTAPHLCPACCWSPLLYPAEHSPPCAPQSPAASPPLHSPSQALVCRESVTSLSCGRGGCLVGPYLASWASTFHTPSWRQERRYLGGLQR